MPKKSTKSKSKRQTLRQKHKVIRKVKEHHRKKNKEAKKQGNKPKKVKDPGIPAQWPFKQELIKEMEWQKQRILHQEQQKKDAKKAAKVQQRTGAAVEASEEAMPQALTMQDVQAEAKRKRQDFEAAEPTDEQPHTGKDSSRRAFFKDFARVVEAADVILHVLDARDPIATCSTDVEQYVRKAGPDKRVVLLLNKIDLIPREAAEAWLKRLREELPTLAFKCSTQSQKANLAHRKIAVGSRKKADAGKGWQAKKGLPTANVAPGNAAESAWQGSQCLGADTLMQLLKNYARSSGIKTAITVGVVGVPNVGKSSLINSLVRARATQTGNTPGVTRVAQSVHLDKHITLLDSPGLVLGPAHAATSALHSFTKVEQIEDPVAAVADIVGRCPAKALMRQYKVPSFASTDEFLQRVASSRGRLLPGGIADSQAAARIVLQDWNDGRIAYYTLPPPKAPEAAAAESATLVSAPAPQFDADAAYGAEGKAVIAELPPLASAEEGNAARRRAGWFEAQSGVPVQIANLDGEDEAAALDSGDEDAKSQAARGAQSANQTQTLYQQPGQFNPHAARAERKRAKKEARGGVISSHAADALADMMLGGGAKAISDDEDYDVDEAFAAENHAGSESGEEESHEEAGSIDDGDASIEDLDP